MNTYYQNKLHILESIFGTTDITLHPDSLRIRDVEYPIVRDVIILLASQDYTAFVRSELDLPIPNKGSDNPQLAFDIQCSFGEEWSTYSDILPEHEVEFHRYFDLVDLSTLQNKLVLDLGCGNGRWSYFLRHRCKSLLLVDFSDAIFAARHNLRDSDTCLFFMGDLQALPFTDNAADLLFCLGVLHHLPTPCIDEVIKLRRFAPQLLIFLYYALDNRPIYFRILLHIMTLFRVFLTSIRHPTMRKWIAALGTYTLYIPLISFGHLVNVVNLGRYVPLFDFYRDRTRTRIQQDVYDRFFTSIEQRVSRDDIQRLERYFRRITISDDLPYWHFLCGR